MKKRKSLVKKAALLSFKYTKKATTTILYIQFWFLVAIIIYMHMIAGILFRSR
jgi:hypothetical protein